MRTIVSYNQKGGSGKTTLVVNLAAALGARKRRVLVIDLDPMAASSAWLGVKDGGQKLRDVFLEGAPLAPTVQPTSANGVEIVPSSAWMIGVERNLSAEVGSETILRSRLEALPRGQWDYILIDTPPSFGTLAANGMVAANELFIPVEAHYLALDGVADLLKTVAKIKERLNPRLEITGVVPCRVTRTRHAGAVVESLNKKFGKVVLPSIRENVRIAEAPGNGQPVIVYSPESIGAEDFTALAKAVIAQEKTR